MYLAATPPVGVLPSIRTRCQRRLCLNFPPAHARLYSIASSQAESEDEVHLTVGMLRYTHHGQAYSGAASAF